MQLAMVGSATPLLWGQGFHTASLLGRDGLTIRGFARIRASITLCWIGTVGRKEQDKNRPDIFAVK